MREDSTGFTWWPMNEEDLYELALSERTETNPEIWQRDDGACLIYPARTHLFIGKPEACKTWTALAICAEEIRNGYGALFIDMEDQPATAVDRLLALGLNAQDIATGFVYVQPGEAFGDVASEFLYQTLDHKEPARKVRFAVIDSMTEALALSGGDADKSTNIATFYHSLPDRLAQERGIAVVTIDHVPKNAKGDGWAIGSQHKISGLSGAAYTFEGVHAFGRGLVGEVAVSLNKDRIGSLRPITKTQGDDEIATIILASDGKTVTVTTESATIDMAKLAAREDRKSTELMHKVYEVIEANPGITKSKIQKLVTGRYEVVSDALDKLVMEGMISVEHGLKNSQLFTVLVPFSLRVP